MILPRSFPWINLVFHDFPYVFCKHLPEGTQSFLGKSTGAGETGAGRLGTDPRGITGAPLGTARHRSAALGGWCLHQGDLETYGIALLQSTSGPQRIPVGLSMTDLMISGHISGPSNGGPPKIMCSFSVRNPSRLREMLRMDKFHPESVWILAG